MTSVAPPPPPPAPAAPSAPPQLPTAVVPNPPAALMQLPAGARFEGTVTIEGTKTFVQIQTTQASFEIQTALPLASGARLDLLLQSVAPRLRLQILTVDGKVTLLPQPTAQGPAPALGGAPEGTASAVAGAKVSQTGSPFPRFAIGARGTAVLIAPAAPAWSPAPGMVPGPSVMAGSPAPAALFGGQSGNPGPLAPSPIPIAGTGGERPGGSRPTTGPAGTTAPTSTPPQVSAIAGRGARIPVHVVAAQPPHARAQVSISGTQAASSSLAPGATIQGPVTGFTATGQPLVTTAAGTLALALGDGPPIGTAITLRVTGPVTAGPPPTSADSALVDDVSRLRGWPALRDAFQALQQVSPAAAHRLSTAVLPRPDARLAADILFFLSALRGGDLGGWWGNATAGVLARARPDLHARLSDEFLRLGRQTGETAQGDWRSQMFPIYAQGEIQAVRLFTRASSDEDGSGGKKGKELRFLIDLSLSRLGRIQLDGLVRDGRRRLDLILRSESPLPSPMQHDIQGIFEEAGAITGVRGGLAFQTSPPDFVEVATGSAAAQPDGVFV